MSLELKRLKLELKRVETARNELEFKIDEQMENINRLKDHINIQLKKEEELTQKIKEFKEK